MSISLQEHLRQQLLGTRLSPQDMAAVDILIESLNEDGYLADSLEDIAASLLPEDADEDTRQQRWVQRSGHDHDEWWPIWAAQELEFYARERSAELAALVSATA